MLTHAVDGSSCINENSMKVLFGGGSKSVPHLPTGRSEQNVRKAIKNIEKFKWD